MTDVGEPALVRASSIEIIRGSVLAGRYQIEAVIGRGGSGIVLRAFDRVAQVAVAVKILKPDLAADPRWVERFSRELRLARQIQHPNVCRVFDIGQADGHWFITMELATAGTLRDQLADKASARTLEEKLRDVTAVVSGLAAIHGAGIVHRDVKPDNFLRMDDGRLVLSDFGLATNPGEAPAVSILVGTPFYMAPEVVMGDVATPRSDVWAAAVVIHEILLGARPERSPATRAPLVKIPGDAPRVTKALLDVCRQSFLDDSTDRPADGAALGEHVDAAMTSRRTSLQSRSRARRRAVWATTIAATVALTAIVGKRLWQRAEASAPIASYRGDISFAGTPRDLIAGSRVLATFDQRVHCLTMLPGGETARIVWGKPRMAEDIEVGTGRRTGAPIAAETYQTDCPQLSPRGDSLLYTRLSPGASPLIMRAKVDGQDAKPLINGAEPRWLPNGEEFLYDIDTAHAAIFSLPTMSSTIAPDDHGSATRYLYKKAVSPRGDLIAVAYNGDAGNRILDLYSLPDLHLAASWRVPLSIRGVGFTGNKLTLTDTAGRGTLDFFDWRSGQGLRAATVEGQLESVFSAGGMNVMLSSAKTSDVWIFNPGQKPRQLTHDGRSFSAAWSPTGDVLVSSQISDSRLAIFRFDVAGHARQVTQGPLDTLPSFSVDGSEWTYVDYDRHMVVLCNDAGCRDVRRGNLPGWPVISPDHRHVAFIEQGGTNHLSVVDRDGSNRRDLGPAAYACSPVWTSSNSVWNYTGTEDARRWDEIDITSGKTGRSIPAPPADPDAVSCAPKTVSESSPFFQHARVIPHDRWEVRTTTTPFGD
ncbi:MAG TPA: protein kinase [Polyangia bacterium]|nr:protein kinase [Polyangia bacterium]